MSQLETLKVGMCLPEAEGRELAKKTGVKILSSRWVLTQKKVGLARCRQAGTGVCIGCRQSFQERRLCTDELT